jgi:predicted lipid-binding transport protein (Tim44 family)
MGGSVQYIDIILFALLALFLVYRLSTVLGRRGGDQKHSDPLKTSREGAKDTGDNVVTLPDRGGDVLEEKEPDDPVESGLWHIGKADPSFRRNEFVKGARAAFEMVVEAFASGNGKVLKSLLDGPVYENFAAAIREREKAGQTLETTLVGIDKSDIVGAEMQNRNARITVKFISGQVNATRDADGEVVDGDISHVVQVTDVWTFNRDTGAGDPNWILVATGSPD